MTTNRFDRVKEILLAAADLPAEVWAAYLDKTCKDDPDLRREVETLLAHEDDATGIMRTGGIAPAEGSDSPTETAAPHDTHSDSIGPYKILEPIGEGGMGVVYLAEQTEPVRRRVALKVIKLGMDTKQVVARFEAERQALAMMDHPNIAKVLDAGATEDGRPYFAMEHVQGVAITDYCDRHELKTRERLELFSRVCDALQHAHQKGVIHRDLKPSNVLVEVVDDQPVPKVIDFGVAKATAQRLTERTVYTEQGQLIGTPEYMSPEQAEMTGLNIDTRTDIYSLGVLLYELLVGALPFDPQTLRSAGYAEIQRILREVDPPKPSTRLSSLGADSNIMAKRRRTDRSTLLGQLRGDLDWITMKALEKDRTRRYASASEFAADVRRFLNDEPILARPPSVTYQMRKLLARHKGPVAFATALFLLVAASSVTMTILYGNQKREAKKSAQISRFLQGMLSSVDPGHTQGREVTVEYILDEAVRKLADEPIADPLHDHATNWDWANLDLADSLYDAAFQIRRKTLGEEHPDIAQSLLHLGDIQRHRRNLAPAESLVRASLDMRKKILDNDHEDVAASLTELGRVLRMRGDYAGADRALRQGLQIYRKKYGDFHPIVAWRLIDLAWNEELLHEDYAAAESLQREALSIRRRLYGDDHHLTTTSMRYVVETLKYQGKYAAAESIYREFLDIRRKVYGEVHGMVAALKENLAYLHALKGDYASAEALYREALSNRRQFHGEEHSYAVDTMQMLAGLLRESGGYAESESLFRTALAMRRRLDGDRHIRVVSAMMRLAELLQDKSEYEEAETLYRDALRLKRELIEEGASKNWLPRGLLGLGTTLTVTGRAEEGEALLREGWTVYEETYQRGNLMRARLRSALGECLTVQGRREEAEEALLYAHRVLRHDGGARVPWKMQVCRRLIALYEAWGKPEQAAEYRGELQALQSRIGK